MTWLLKAMGRKFGVLLPQLVGLGLFAYFAFHFVQGERGLRAYAKLGKELDAAWAEESALQRDLTAARARVAALSTQALDPDLLEERAQAVLNFAKPEELVIILPDSEFGDGTFEAE